MGLIVPPDLRADWTLLIEGDRKNLPRIVAEIGAMDLFHYDSDKSLVGRRWATRLIAPRRASPSGLGFR